MVVWRKMALAAVSLTICSLSLSVSNKVRKALTPIRPNPWAHSALTLAEGSLVTPSMKRSSPCGPKFFMEIRALCLTDLSLSKRHL